MLIEQKALIFKEANKRASLDWHYVLMLDSLNKQLQEVDDEYSTH